MTYRETLAQIYGLARFGIKPGLERISRLLSSLGNPHLQLRSISIAGTNGKGSTASFLASILAASGHRVGLFTSPHLISFTERIRINDAQISEEDVTRLAAKVTAVAPAQSTFFEIVTAMALLYFHEQEVDFAVMETGMGGRFDSTNVTDPLISIITPISLDHCEYLGNSIAAIAREKAGIIRPGRPVVCAGQENAAMTVLEERAAAGNSPLFLAGREFTAIWRDSLLDYWGIKEEMIGLQPGIMGRYQAENASCAIAAAELLADRGSSITLEAIRSGVSSATWPGRMEIFPGPPRVMLDGAHNPGGSRALADELPGLRYDRLTIVFGVMGDKNVTAILEPLIPFASRVIAVSPSLDRAMPADELSANVRAMGGDCITAGSVEDGVRSAIDDSTPDDLVLVCGSLFTVGEARAALLGRSCELVRG